MHAWKTLQSSYTSRMKSPYQFSTCWILPAEPYNFGSYHILSSRQNSPRNSKCHPVKPNQKVKLLTQRWFAEKNIFLNKIKNRRGSLSPCALEQLQDRLHQASDIAQHQMRPSHKDSQLKRNFVNYFIRDVTCNRTAHIERKLPTSLFLFKQKHKS